MLGVVEGVGGSLVDGNCTGVGCRVGRLVLRGAGGFQIGNALRYSWCIFLNYWIFFVSVNADGFDAASPKVKLQRDMLNHLTGMPRPRGYFFCLSTYQELMVNPYTSVLNQCWYRFVQLAPSARRAPSRFQVAANITGSPDFQGPASTVAGMSSGRRKMSTTSTGNGMPLRSG